VHYRLDRLHERTGRDARRFRDPSTYWSPARSSSPTSDAQNLTFPVHAIEPGLIAVFAPLPVRRHRRVVVA